MHVATNIKFKETGTNRSNVLLIQFLKGLPSTQLIKFVLKFVPRNLQGGIRSGYDYILANVDLVVEVWKGNVHPLLEEHY